MTPRYFAEHLKILRQYVRPIRLQELSQALIDGNLPDRSVAVTFDDGYADNFHNAKPALERYDVPATFFLTTSYIGRNDEMWWDELDRILLVPAALPKSLRLSINGDTYNLKLTKRTFHYNKVPSGRPGYWRVWGNPRHRLCRLLRKLLRPLPEDERREVLDKLSAWAGLKPVPSLAHRFLSLQEVVALDQGEMVEIGAHTMTHPVLAALPTASQRSEILGSKIRLQEVLGRPVTSFAYPYGSRSDYTAETVSIVKEEGFTCACSNFAGLIEQSTERFQLPRFSVLNWNGEEFARRLARWLKG